MEARHLARRNTWIPPTPEELLKLASNKRFRLIRSSDDLLLAVEESLNDLQRKLYGETPAVRDLWLQVKWSHITRWTEYLLSKLGVSYRREDFIPDVVKRHLGKAEYNRGVFIPGEENDLSDYIGRHLKENLKHRGVIVNREVEIRRGEETDIKVEVNVLGKQANSDGHYTVIIEVKGSWNSELNKAMKTQLVDRYLKDYHSHHGLYVIGWFYCDAWDDGDPRKRKSRRDLSKAQKQYGQQAKDLSDPLVRVKAFILDVSLRQEQDV